MTHWIFFNLYDADDGFIETVGYPTEIDDVYISEAEFMEAISYEALAQEIAEQTDVGG